MTTVIVLDNSKKDNGKLKPIQFTHFISDDGKLDTDVVHPNMWENIELVCKNYNGENLDLFFAYDDNERDEGGLYLGHFNDGIV
jgi:hypothetical protein